MKKVILFLILIFIYLFHPLFADENISIEGMATNGTDVMISVYDKINSKMYEILYNGKNFEVILKFPINESELFNNSKINFEPKDWNFYNYFKHPIVVGYFKGKWIFYSPEMLGFFDGRAFTTTISGLYSGCSTASISKFKSSDDVAFIVWSGSTTSCSGEWLCAYYNLPGKNIFPYRQGYYGIAYNSKNDFWYIYYFNNFTNNSIYIWKNEKIIRSFNLPNDKIEVFHLYHLNYQPMECDNNGNLLIPLTSPPKYSKGLYLYNGKNLTKISNITPYVMCRGDKGVLMATNDGLYMYKDGTITDLSDFGFKRVDYIIYVNKKGYWLIAGMDKNNTTKLIKFNENSSIEDLTQQLANTTNYNKKIEEIDKEIDEITSKLKELESENPNDERIKIYKQKLEQLIEKRHELKSKNPKYNETLNYIQSEEYWKMQEEIWEYNNRIMKWFIAISILILGMILSTLYILRKDKFLLFLAVFGLIVPFLQFEIPNWLFNILALPLFVYVKFFIPKYAGGSFYYSPLIIIPISMYGWILIGLAVKFVIKKLKKFKEE
ncbi:hypothetical protein Metvu_1644 [Methanocaldococcus vulcanius M7]|uniref:Uncharacterized protein n=1 Tax=Methanocaldococcus vulcanius (strain ATCC 700851 / DSM 12094 / M7) TaxID=579137 RepID=C9RDW8_METVM|nr:hypothetical protein [Methanocaldococcus vulcanius]ACX73497.1 hypothetical protein Metvu_1644 [Methanocaldococcus vulcanius M7]